MTNPRVSEQTLQEWANFAEKLADEARSISARYFRKAYTRTTKEDHSPVTEADRAIEAALRALIIKQFPAHSIYGEEMGATNTGSPTRWVLDPIDGTRAFMAGIPTFTTLIGVTHHDIPVIGVIDQPHLKERWIGIQGKPTLFNHVPISLTTPIPSALDEAMLGTTDPLLFTDWGHAAYVRLRQACGSRVCGGDAYLYGRLAQGTIHVVMEQGTKVHDFCALRPVIEGMGGIITDWSNNPLTYHSNGTLLAASSAELHRAALSQIASPA